VMNVNARGNTEELGIQGDGREEKKNVEKE
jgi:hypothetical protein